MSVISQRKESKAASLCILRLKAAKSGQQVVWPGSDPSEITPPGGMELPPDRSQIRPAKKTERARQGSLRLGCALRSEN